jgi:hypothetical protein
LLSSRSLGENYGNNSPDYLDPVVGGRFSHTASSQWMDGGYYASGGFALLVSIVIILVLVWKN